METRPDIRPFIYIAEFRVFVCEACGYAVLPIHMESHLANANHGWTRQERAELTAKIEDMDVRIQNEGDLVRHYRQPSPDSVAIQYLPVHRDGFQCGSNSECRYITTTEKKIRAHLRSAHGWNNSRKAGRPRALAESQVSNNPWTSIPFYQRFFNRPPVQRHFEVQQPESEEEGATESWAASQTEKIDRKRRELQQRNRDTIEEPTKLDTER